MLSFFGGEKIHSHFQFHCYWSFYIWKKTDEGYLKFFLLNMCAPRIMALLVLVHFMFKQEILIDGFVLKKNFSSYSFAEAALTMGFFWI